MSKLLMLECAELIDLRQKSLLSFRFTPAKAQSRKVFLNGFLCAFASLRETFSFWRS